MWHLIIQFSFSETLQKKFKKTVFKLVQQIISFACLTAPNIPYLIILAC